MGSSSDNGYISSYSLHATCDNSAVFVAVCVRHWCGVGVYHLERVFRDVHATGSVPGDKPGFWDFVFYAPQYSLLLPFAVISVYTVHGNCFPSCTWRHCSGGVFK